MSRHRGWPATTRAEAERLAAEVGIDEAARRTEVPRGTVAAWVSRSRKRQADQAEQLELDRQAAEAEAQLEAEVLAGGGGDDLVEVEKNLRTANAKLSGALAGDRASNARYYATVVGILVDKAKVLRAEAASKRAEGRGRFSGDPRDEIARLLLDLSERRLMRAKPDLLDGWAEDHDTAAVWLREEAARRRAGAEPSVDDRALASTLGLRNIRAALAGEGDGTHLETGAAGRAAAAIQSVVIDEGLEELEAEVEARGLGGEVERQRVIADAGVLAERLMAEGPAVVELVEEADGADPDEEPAAEVVSIDRRRLYGEARDEAFRREFGRYPWDGPGGAA